MTRRQLGLLAALAILFVLPGLALAQSEPTSQPTDEPPAPYEPGAEDLACEGDHQCEVTCQFSAYSCCPTYCTACTFTLNRAAATRRAEECAAAGEECPTVGACAEQPSERAIPRCVEGSCTFELVPVEAPAAP